MHILAEGAYQLQIKRVKYLIKHIISVLFGIFSFHITITICNKTNPFLIAIIRMQLLERIVRKSNYKCIFIF